MRARTASLARAVALPLLALLFATDAGAGHWERLEGSVYGERYDDLHFITPEEGWAVNGFGEIWHTDDGGESWEMQYDNGYIYFRSIEFANSQIGWAGTITSGHPPLFRTDNGGESWHPVRNLPGSPRPFAFCGIHVVDENVMFATGVWSGPGYILRTTDGGRTYQGMRVPEQVAVGLIDVYFKDADEGFVVGGVGDDLFTGKPVILRTLDGGQTWTRHYIGTVEGAWGWKISFPTPSVGYVSVERIQGPHYFLKTVDGGETWTEMPFVGGARSQGIGFVTEKIGWIGGPAAVNPTYVTFDGGVNWAVSNFGVELNRFQFFGTDVGYGAGDYIYKYSTRTGFDTVDIVDTAPTPERPTRSFPNPLRSMTTIAYTLPADADVRLFVSDPGGRLLRTLTDGPVSAGAHEIVWDGKDDQGRELPSGLYLYVIRSSALDAIGKLVKVE